ncbi:MAG: hypothetical protein KKD39_04560 [Candidatus Altiarchaeota archaeon]|nr:hypothetical protein [Candidatus Altiarchaeota archaeon]
MNEVVKQGGDASLLRQKLTDALDKKGKLPELKQIGEYKGMFPTGIPQELTDRINRVNRDVWELKVLSTALDDDDLRPDALRLMELEKQRKTKD